MPYNKVIYGGKTLIDLTGDSVTADKMLKGATAHDKTGASIVGTCTYDMDTSEFNATAYDILEGSSAGVKGSEIVGAVKRNGCVNGTISVVDEEFTIPIGHHDGSGVVGIHAQERAKIIPANIREGVVILGVTGTMSGSEDVKAQTKTVTPKTTAQTVIPDEDYNYMTQVSVAAIPYTETDNSAGGTTVTIAG